MHDPADNLTHPHRAAPASPGAIGLLTGVFGVYGGIVETTLPNFPPAPAKNSLKGSLIDPLQRVRKDAGMRRQL